jgi:hypothetical protein
MPLLRSLVADVLNPLIAATDRQARFQQRHSACGRRANQSRQLFQRGHFIPDRGRVVYLAIVLPMNAMQARMKKPRRPTTKNCPECLSEIPLAARRCAHCAQPVASTAVACSRLDRVLKDRLHDTPGTRQCAFSVAGSFSAGVLGKPSLILRASRSAGQFRLLRLQRGSPARRKFLAVPDPKLAGEELKTLTAEPHLAATPEDRKTAEYVARKFRAAGLETEIVPYRVLLNSAQSRPRRGLGRDRPSADERPHARACGGRSRRRTIRAW